MEAVMDYFPMDYEVEVAETACKQNSIVYLPYQRGKNYVLYSVIKHLLYQTHPPYNKYIVVIAQSEIMVQQLKLMLDRCLIVKVEKSHKTNQMQFPSSIQPKRSEETSDSLSKVLVLQSVTLSNMLDEGKIEMERISLICVLECQNIFLDLRLQQLMEKIGLLACEAQPQILGITSSLIHDLCDEDGVENLLQTLKRKYYSHIVSVGSIYTLLKVMGCPEEHFCTYENFVAKSDVCLNAIEILDQALTDVCNFEFEFSNNLPELLRQGNIEHGQDIYKILIEIKVQMKLLGECGASKAALTALTDLEHLIMLTDDVHTPFMLKHLVCQLTRFRKKLEDDMFRVQLSDRAERFSSERVQLIVQYLCQLNEGQRAMIYVQDKHTASIIASLLQDVSQKGKTLKHIKAELMFEARGIPASEYWADVLAWDRNMEVHRRFIALETNTLVLSGEVGGLDFPKCDLVLLFDEVAYFPKYLETKNRVCCRHGKLVLFINRSKLGRYEKHIEAFHAIESQLHQVLLKNPCFLGMKRENESGDTSSSVHCTSTMSTAIPILNRYCKQLPGDRFTVHQPVWWKEVINGPSGNLFVAHLQMPHSSPMQEIIKGDPMSTLYSAMQSAALKTCEALQRKKELDDALKPELGVKLKPNIEQQLFPNGLHTCIMESGTSCFYNLNFPEVFEAARPKEGQDTYVHRIKSTVISESPLFGDNRSRTLFSVLSDKEDFAIVCTKPLPKLCKFPIFMYGNTLSVSVETLPNTVKFNQQELEALHKFHCGIFIKVLDIVPGFMQYDSSNTHNSFYVAPLTFDGEINWNVVVKHTTIPEVCEPTEEQRALVQCTPETHERTMTLPWYRPVQDRQVYLISAVCSDMTADSFIPGKDETFHKYFFDKYNLTLKRPDLSMLEVMLVSTRVNGLVPKVRSRKSRRDKEEFKEHMVPELCIPMEFPAALWIKLIGLPSMLHRLSRLLLCHEIRQKIAHEAGVGDPFLEGDMLPVDPICLHQEESQELTGTPSALKRGLVIGNVKLEERKREVRMRKPWGCEQEPVDIHRNMESVNLVEIRYHDKFVETSLSGVTPVHEIPETFGEQEEPESENIFIQKKINLLLPDTDNKQGPELWQIFQALTLPSANDILSCDRIKILGSAFLKVAVSSYLYCWLPFVTPFKILQLRSWLLSNKNLVRCAESGQLCGRVKVVDFAPGEWIPPSFCTAHQIKKSVMGRDLRPKVLTCLNLNEDEQFNGTFSSETEGYVEDILSYYKPEISAVINRDEVYLGRHYVSFEGLASCVQALVGTYFVGSGWRGALKVLCWLGLLPVEKVTGLLDPESPQQPCGVEDHPSLENILGYQFRDKRLLTEAVTHSSYLGSSVCGSMDRLAFLGEGVLDFLITSYIYEKCTHLTPKKLGELRDVLVSRVTFAGLVVRYQLHKFLLMKSPSLLETIDRFVKFQNDHEHEIDDEVRVLLEESECDNIDRVEMPSVLGSLLASLAGAVYLDTGKDFQTVWDIFHPVFIRQIELWSEDVPLSVVDLLYDLSPAPTQVMMKSRKNDVRGDVEVTCRVQITNDYEETFCCHGSTEVQAKTLAAKLALRALLGSPEATIEL